MYRKAGHGNSEGHGPQCMNNIMGEELLMSDCMEDGTHIVIHLVPELKLTNEIVDSAPLTSSCSIQTADISDNSDSSSLLLNASQQQQPLCLEVLDNSLKMGLLVLNKDQVDQQQQQQQHVMVVDNLPLDHLVDNLPLDHLVDTIMTYSCRLCMFVATDVSQLLQHFSAAHCLSLPQALVGATSSQPPQDVPEQAQGNDKLENLVFMCGYCNSNFNSLDDCKQHMSQVHKGLAAEGNASPASTERHVESTEQLEDSRPPETQKKGLRKKLAGPAKEKKIRCTVPSCFRKFTTEDRLQLHISCHVSLDGKCREFQCSKCELRLERWNQCALHLWHAHQLDADLLSCPTCEQYKTVTQVKLTLHMKVHSDLRPYICSICNKGFKQSSQLRNHHVVHVDKKLADPHVPRWYTSQRCKICHKMYADSKCLKTHLKAVHSKLRPYVCQVCGHASAGKSMLKLHMRQHTGDKPYKCTEEGCQFRTGDHNSLRRHTMRHTGKRPYECPHCPYSAIQSSAYKCHLRTRHPDASELYACSLCPYYTVSAENLAHHEVDHKHGLVAPRVNKSAEEGDCEVFPGNVAAAHLIYRCFNPDTSARGATMKASLTGSQTSADGLTQTIMIQIPAPGTDDDDTSHCFLEEEDGSAVVDTGGITIPADPEPLRDVDAAAMFPAFSAPALDSSQVAAV